MNDISKIAIRHLEDVKKSVDGSFKYIVTFLLLIMCSWLFVTEPIFNDTRFNHIRKTQFEIRRSNLLTNKGVLHSKKDETNRLNDKILQQDTLISSSIYSVIEDNIPRPFNSILRIAALDNYGILIISLTILFFSLYVFYLRLQLLRKIAIALRMLKLNGGFNIAHDYNISIPFWTSPIPKDGNYLTRNEFISAVGFKHNKIIKNLIVFLLLFSLTLIQIRLCYISLFINLLLNWVSIIMIFSTVISAYILIAWFLPSKLDDTFNAEDTKSQSSRRDFVLIISAFSVGILFSYFSKNIGSYLIEKNTKPRFSKKKPNKRNSKSYLIEEQASKEITKGNFEGASQIIFDAIRTPNANLNSYIRLFDLIILLCFKKQVIYNSTFNEVINLANRSRVPSLKRRVKTWQSKDNKWKKVLADKTQTKTWNNLKI